MKTKVILLAAFFCMLGIFGVEAAPKQKVSVQTKEVLNNAVHKMLTDQSYTLNFGTATAMKGAPHSCTNAQLIVDGDQVFSALPYYGKGTSTAAFSDGDSGYRFDGTIENYQIEAGKNYSWRVSFLAKVADTSKTYKVTFKIFYNGVTYMTISGGSLQSMSFDGVIAVTEKPAGK